MYFLSRAQTWIPVAALIIGAGIGFLNDYYDVVHGGKDSRFVSVLLSFLSSPAALGTGFMRSLVSLRMVFHLMEHCMLDGSSYRFLSFLTISLYASGVIDGIDGLSGGVFTAVFLSYAGVAFVQSQYDIAALSATIAGGILAFLWFNIPPARFWMTETGSMALTLSLAVIVFMTDELGGGHGIALLPIIGLPLVATVVSNILQLSYRKATGKLFRIAPLHHHFEAIGWPSTKVTMRYWVISIMCAVSGLVLATIM